MSKKVLLLLANGFEEVETITPIDYLRRAGIEVQSASIGTEKIVKGSHGIPVIADSIFSELENSEKISWDAVLVPGGMPGASNIAAYKPAGDFIKNMANIGKLVCAICAAPAIVLFPLGIINGRRFTCYPSMVEKVSGAIYSEESVVTDGNIITSRGAGTAAYWAFAIIGKLMDENTANKIAKAVLI